MDKYMSKSKILIELNIIFFLRVWEIMEFENMSVDSALSAIYF